MDTNPAPQPKGNPLLTPDASPARQAIERRSVTPLLGLHQRAPWLLPLLGVALLVSGIALPGWPGAVALCGVALMLGWLAALSWPGLNPRGRLLRAATVACFLLAAVLQIMRWYHVP